MCILCKTPTRKHVQRQIKRTYIYKYLGLPVKHQAYNKYKKEEELEEPAIK